MDSSRTRLHASLVVAAALLGLPMAPAELLHPAVACQRAQNGCNEGLDGYEAVRWDEVCQTVGTCGPSDLCSGEGGTWTLTDTGNNVLKIECATASCSPALDAFKYYYNDVLVGECVYEYGMNCWLYKKDAEGLFTCVKHMVFDDGCCTTWSDSCHDDDCDNMRDWTVSSYSVGGSVQKFPREGACDDYPQGGWESDGQDSESDCGPTCGG